jgi:hypothetical protein|tara:strand:+ start:135 stop:395 length:261 start_codon:yes stop_codon:yes gene_type:complete
MIKIKKEKVSLMPLIGKTDSETFTTAQALRDIVEAVEPMHNLATAKVATDGQFAKLFADQVAERLENIFKLANDRLSAIIEIETKQ